jgi:hypothetical protein
MEKDNVETASYRSRFWRHRGNRWRNCPGAIATRLEDTCIHQNGNPFRRLFRMGVGAGWAPNVCPLNLAGWLSLNSVFVAKLPLFPHHRTITSLGLDGRLNFAPRS